MEQLVNGPVDDGGLYVLSPGGLFVPAPPVEGDPPPFRMYRDLSPEERAERDRRRAAELEPCRTSRCGGCWTCWGEFWVHPHDEAEEATR